MDKTNFFMLPGAAGSLEVITTWPETLKESTMVIVCHPHPLQGGNMQNKVVTTLTKTFQELNFPTLRFNFRGVGQSSGVSEGRYAVDGGEVQDLVTVIEWVKKTLPDFKVILAGFSFGSYIAATQAYRDEVKQLVSVAPPIDHAPFDKLPPIHCPWLIVQGDQDEVVLVPAVRAFAENPPSPVTYVELPQVGHFFHGKLLELRKVVLDYFSTTK